MPKLKLLISHKDALKKLARRIVECHEQKAKLDKLYESAAVIVAKAVAEKFPPKDMEVLKKYGTSSMMDSPRVILADGSTVQFQYRDGDPRTPLTPIHRAYNEIYRIEGERDSKTVDAAISALADYEEAMRKKLADYNAVIDSTVYAEDLAAIWPDSADLIATWHRTSTALVAISPEVIDRVRKDSRDRQRRAKAA